MPFMAPSQIQDNSGGSILKQSRFLARADGGQQPSESTTTRNGSITNKGIPASPIPPMQVDQKPLEKNTGIPVSPLPPIQVNQEPLKNNASKKDLLPADQERISTPPPVNTAPDLTIPVTNQSLPPVSSRHEQEDHRPVPDHAAGTPQAVQQLQVPLQVQPGSKFAVVRLSTHHSVVVNAVLKAVPIFHPSQTFYRAKDVKVSPEDEQIFKDNVLGLVTNTLAYTSGPVAMEGVEFMMGGVEGGPVMPTVVIKCSSRLRKQNIARKLKARTDLPENFRWKILLNGPILGSLGMNASLASMEGEKGLVEFKIERQSGLGRTISDGKGAHLRIPQTKEWRGLCGQVARVKYGLWVVKNSTPIYEFNGKNSGLFTIGGVVLVRNKLYALTTAHAFIANKSLNKVKGARQKKEASSTEQRRPAEIVNPLRKNTETWTKGHVPLGSVAMYEWSGNEESVPQESAVGNVAESAKIAGSSPGMDWALIELLPSDSILKQNYLNIIDPFLPNSGESDKIEGHRSPFPIRGYMEIKDFEAGQVLVCAGVSGWVTGVLDTVPAVVTIGTADFGVRSIELETPLAKGDSGSWVIQNKRVCGYIFSIVDGACWAYMLPVEPVIKNIARVLECTIESIDLSADGIDKYLASLPETVSQLDEPATGPSESNSRGKRTNTLALEKGKGLESGSSAMAGATLVAENDTIKRKRHPRQSYLHSSELLNFGSPPLEDRSILGSLVLDPSHPMIDCWPDKPDNAHLKPLRNEDVLVSGEREVQIQADSGGGTDTLHFFSSKRTHLEKFQLVSDHRIRHELRQPRQIFSELCSNSNAVNWVNMWSNRGEKLYFIVGYLVFVDVEMQFKDDNGRQLQVSMGAVPAGGEIGAKFESQNMNAVSFRAGGERVWAVGYRQVKFPLLGRRDLGKASLDAKTTWIGTASA